MKRKNMGCHRVKLVIVAGIEAGFLNTWHTISYADNFKSKLDINLFIDYI